MIDTAGMRTKVRENTEKHWSGVAMRAIDRSDVVLMGANAEEGIVSTTSESLALLMKEKGIGCRR